VIKIFAEIVVAKENHRPIVIGKDGQALKKIGTDARKEIEALTGRKVYLELKVASKRNWQKNPGVMKELGYVAPKA
jgi:GTP-binding protein Era